MPPLTRVSQTVECSRTGCPAQTTGMGQHFLSSSGAERKTMGLRGISLRVPGVGFSPLARPARHHPEARVLGLALVREGLHARAAAGADGRVLLRAILLRAAGCRTHAAVAAAFAGVHHAETGFV